MFNSRTETLHFIRVIIFVSFSSAVAIFVFFRSLNYIKGPLLEINSPNNGALIDTSTVQISGYAQRINKITINDFPISIDEQGNWKETRVVFPGINKISIKVEDKFGRTIIKQLDIVGQTNQ